MVHLYSLFLSLHIINKLWLHMSSLYWGKTLIKPLNLTQSVYNVANNGSETEKRSIRTINWGDKVCWQVITWSDKPHKARYSRHVDVWAWELTIHLDTRAFKYARHAYTWAEEHENHVGTLGREHVKYVGTWAPKHVIHLWHVNR